MSAATDRIRNSRISEAISTLESGGQVDWQRIDLLQSLDFVQEGKLQLADAIELNDEFDGRAEQFLRSLP